LDLFELGILGNNMSSDVPASIQAALWNPSTKIATSRTHSSEKIQDVLHGYRVLHPEIIPGSQYPSIDVQPTSYRYEIYSVLPSDTTNLNLEECWGPTGLNLATHFLLLFHVGDHSRQADHLLHDNINNTSTSTSPVTSSISTTDSEFVFHMLC